METSIIIPVVAVLLLAAWVAVGRASENQVGGFAELYRVDVVDGNAELIRDSLTRTRRFRAIGAALSVITLMVVDAGSVNFWSMVGAVAAGFAIGSLVDELTQQHPTAGVVAASLEHRSLRTYVERWVLVFVGLMVVVLAGQVLVSAGLRSRVGEGGWFIYAPDGPLPSYPPFPPSGRAIVLAGGLGFGAFVIAALALRRLVQRPVIHDTPALQAARHALRTAAVLSVVGAALMTLGISGVQLATQTVLSDGPESRVVQWIDNLSLMASFVAVLFGMSMSLQALPRRTSIFARRARQRPDSATS